MEITILQGLQYIVDNLDEIPVAGMSNREKINNCQKMAQMMIDGLQGKEAQNGSGDDAQRQRQAKNDAGAV